MDWRKSSSEKEMLESKALQRKSPTFIDLFAGCGGFSLGLSQAGWKGRFAIERATDAFETFRANFLEKRSPYLFEWPEWLEEQAHSIEDVLETKRQNILDLRGTVDLIAGGPPCQGFSFAGKRSASDPRNKMFQRYVEFVDLVRPTFLVLENVPGMKVAHRDGRGVQRKTYYQKLVEDLGELGYDVAGEVLDSSTFGVPQRRPRLVVIGVCREAALANPSILRGQDSRGALLSIYEDAKAAGARKLQSFGCLTVSAAQAISDLEVGGDELQTTEPYMAESTRGQYRQIKYAGPRTTYQTALHSGLRGAMDSMRLANHTKRVRKKFKEILTLSRDRRGVNLSAEIRNKLGMLKHRTVPMDAARPAPTLTTLPDDIIHYSEPRILTVREYARLQSFPDWFVFKGKYTTGGSLRKVECPRYTQVGNAVPPLLAEAIGKSLMSRAKHQKPAPYEVALIDRRELHRNLKQRDYATAE